MYFQNKDIVLIYMYTVDFNRDGIRGTSTYRKHLQIYELGVMWSFSHMTPN